MEHRSFVVVGRGSHEAHIMAEAQRLADEGIAVRIITNLGSYLLAPSRDAIDEACNSVEFATALARKGKGLRRFLGGIWRSE